MAKKTKVVYESDKLYKLLEDPAQGLILEVVAGGAAMYAVRMVLTESEKKQYSAKGTGWLDTLAADVVKNEPRYRQEGRTVPV